MRNQTKTNGENEMTNETIIHETRELCEGTAVELFTNPAGKSGYRVFDADVENETNEKATYTCWTFPSFDAAKIAFNNDEF